MGVTKHEKSFVDYEKQYEQNIIGLKGIVYFGIGLLILIVITFSLMWALLGVLEDNAQQTKKPDNPLMMSEKERLPPEPRLQSAPGFGVEGPNGRVNMELRAPQAEYIEMRSQWEEMWKKGSIDKATGAVTGLPIAEAKEKFLAQSVKARAGDPLPLTTQSQMSISDASSGRMATLRRR